MTMNRFTGHLCTYNDCEYLDAAIESFQGAVDKLYIIEGSWQTLHGMESSLRSSVETYNVIDKWVDNKKIFLIQANEAGERQQRQVGLEKAKEDGADWHWFLDSDEIYTKQVVQLIRKSVSEASPQIYGFRVRSFNFINSFNRWYDGNYARIARVTPGARFFENNDVCWEDQGAKIQTLSDRWRFYHYCYVKRDPAHLHRKLFFHRVEDATFQERIGHKYATQGHIYQIPSEITQFKFTGKHPRIMQNHPNIKANIYDDQNIQFSSF